MKSIRFESHLHRPDGLPLIIWNTTLKNGEQSGANLHENAEILYCYDGSGRITLDATTYQVQPGDFIVANTNIAHRIEADESLSYICLIIYRDYALTAGIDTNSLSFTPAFRNDPELSDLMERLKDEFSKNIEYRSAALCSLALTILVRLARYHAETIEDPTPEGVTGAVSYIKSHYAESFTLEDVAHHVGYSLSYLSHEFRTRTGSTVIQYLNMIRCEYAKPLLRIPSIPIAEVCERCGYHNDSYFTRTFRKYNGITPSEYRKKAISEAKKAKK